MVLPPLLTSSYATSTITLATTTTTDSHTHNNHRCLTACLPGPPQGPVKSKKWTESVVKRDLVVLLANGSTKTAAKAVTCRDFCEVSRRGPAAAVGVGVVAVVTVSSSGTSARSVDVVAMVVEEQQ